MQGGTRCPQRVELAELPPDSYAFSNGIVFGQADLPDGLCMSEKILLALSTFPDPETAREISNQLVSGNFTACANILPAIESIYRWKGQIETGSETLVFFKLSEDRRSAFEEKLRSLHPYDVPEIIFVPVAGGLQEYLQWVSESCGQAH